MMFCDYHFSLIAEQVNLYLEGNKMSLEDNLIAAQAAVDAANANLATAQAAIDAALPHLSVLSEIEGYRNHLSAELVTEFDALIAKARALF